MSEPISELVRAYTAEIAALRKQNELLRAQAETNEKTISMLLSEVRSLRASVGAGDTAIRYLENQIDAYEATLREIRAFASGRIAAMIDMALPLPESSEPVSADGSIPF